MYSVKHNILIPPIYSINPQLPHTRPLNQALLHIQPLLLACQKSLEAASMLHSLTIYIYYLNYTFGDLVADSLPYVHSIHPRFRRNCQVPQPEHRFVASPTYAASDWDWKNLLWFCVATYCTEDRSPHVSIPTRSFHYKIAQRSIFTRFIPQRFCLSRFLYWHMWHCTMCVLTRIPLLTIYFYACSN